MYPVPAHLAHRKRADQFTEVEKEEKVVHTGGPKLVGMLLGGVMNEPKLTVVVDAQRFREAMKVASDDTIALEPELTRWDTVSTAYSFRRHSKLTNRLSEMAIVVRLVRRVRRPSWKH
jgi:hypothetical protein